MKSKEIGRALALAAVFMAAATFGISAQPVFEVHSEAMPVGQGIPGGISLDVIGLYPGQSGDEALDVLTAYYSARDGGAPIVTNSKLSFADAPYISVLTSPQLMHFRLYDMATVLFSSNGSGNQAILVAREVKYEAGSWPSYLETKEAIFKKYGPPSVERDGMFLYGFRDGNLLGNETCLIETVANLGPPQLRSGIRIDTPERAARFYIAKPDSGCDVFMSIRIEHPIENGAYNTNVVDTLTVKIFDAQRYVFTSERDAQAQAELNALAQSQQSTGSGAAGL